MANPKRQRRGGSSRASDGASDPSAGEAPIEHTFPSTAWEWRRVTVSRGAAGQASTARRSRSFLTLPPRNPRDPLALTISYRGGPEAWYEVHARGKVIRRPGSIALHDLMRQVNSLQP